jgi:release factor glutamine methyltransferase
MSDDFAELIARSGLPFHEAATLLSRAAGVNPTMLATAELPDDLSPFFAAVEKRKQGVPLQYLTGTAHFRMVSVEVGPGVFIPRPETEVMTGWAIERLTSIGRELSPADAVPVVIELCAGSGAISLSIGAEAAGLEQYAVEDDPVAFEYTERNLGPYPISLELADLADALPRLNGRADLVIANPPYIPETERPQVAAEVVEHEPEHALFAGADGLDVIRKLVPAAARLLKPGGALVFEHAESNAEAAAKLARESGFFGEVEIHPDLTGRPRFTTALRTAAKSPAHLV